MWSVFNLPKISSENEEYPRAIEYLPDHQNGAHACNENVFILKYILGQTSWQRQKVSICKSIYEGRTLSCHLKAG